MSNSPLVSYTKLSPNHSGQRTHAVDRITPHCVVGQCSVETLGNIFTPTSRQASCQYGIGVDGRVGMYVEEKNRSWCSSSNANDQRAITIECASDATALLRRSQNKPAVNTVKLGDITVDFSGYTASDENGKIDITPKELEILKVLIDNKGLVLSRNQILDEVWGYDCDVIDRTIDAYIRNIRKKLRLDCITTVKGIGYKFEMGQAI